MWHLIRKICVGLLLATTMQMALGQGEVLQKNLQLLLMLSKPQWQVLIINKEIVELYQKGEYSLALEKGQAVVKLAMQALGPTHISTRTSLNLLAELYRGNDEYGKALPLIELTLEIAENEEGPEHAKTGIQLNLLVRLYQSMGEYKKALPLATRALAIFEKVEGTEHSLTGTALNNLAQIYQYMGEYKKALPLFVRALAITEKAQGAENFETAIRLNNLAVLYGLMGEYGNALPLYTRAVAISEEIYGPEHYQTGGVLGNMAMLYEAIGAYEKALPLLVRALAIVEKSRGPDHPETGIVLNNLGALYESMASYENALPLYVRALAIAEKTLGPEHHSTGIRLNNLGHLYGSIGAYEKSLPLFARALAIFENTQGPEHLNTSFAVNNLGVNYFMLNQFEKALQLNLHSFAIAFSHADTTPELLAATTENLCALNRTSNRPSAIFYCKLAVNTRQTLRHNAKSMDKALQRMLHIKTQDSYLLLNQLLTDAQRYFEAEEVLNAMKAAEINEATRAETVANKPLSQTKTEAALAQELTTLGQTLARQLQEKEHLKNLPDTQIQRDKNQHQINLTKQNILVTLNDVGERLKEVDQEAAQVFSVKDTKSYQLANALLKEAPKEGNLIIFISANEELTTVNLVTPNGYHPFSIAVGMKQLAPLIGKMRNAILDKSAAYREPAQEIYRLLFAPIEARPEFKAKTLTLFLNGRLRGLPVAALLDAEGKYFIQKYRFGLYNIVVQDKAADMPKTWRIQAWGNPKGYPDQGLRALPAVEAELKTLVRTQPGDKGILRGKGYLGKDFNGPSWRAMLAQSSQVSTTQTQSERSVLHVATHFKLVPGNMGESQLFLGDDSKFTLGELQGSVADLSDVDLLTLSACHSLSHEKSKNGEFESLGAIFQSKGVKAVLGTLWAVQDASTAELMQQFYAARGEKRAMSKAQALQQAQQKMIESKGKSNDWSHPYYWSGFVLMGNWL